MSKKVLIVEPSLAVRGIAESLLRQNGYEVIAADTAVAARDILKGSKVDLLLVASDIADDSGIPFFEALGADSSTAMLPLLILHDSAAGGEIAYPPEAIVNKPFTPRDFLEAVAVFGGGQSSPPEQKPFGGDDLEDAIIDSALGLDKIEVDDAEVLEDDTSSYKKQNKNAKVESMIGFDAKVSSDDSQSISKNQVDSINVPPDPVQQPTRAEAPQQAAKPEPPAAETPPKEKVEDEFLGDKESVPGANAKNQLSESSKIEIITDQYGISVPEETLEFAGSSGDGSDHDYDWFMKELQNESREESTSQPETDKKSEPESTPPSAPQPTPPTPPAAPQDKPATHTEAVDQFINEFKKEMEKITGDSGENIEVTNIAPPDLPRPPVKKDKPVSSSELKWEEGLENISPAEIRSISRKLIECMAAQIADKITARLDEDIIYHLIKETVDNILRRQAEEKSR